MKKQKNNNKKISELVDKTNKMQKLMESLEEDLQAMKSMIDKLPDIAKKQEKLTKYYEKHWQKECDILHAEKPDFHPLILSEDALWNTTTGVYIQAKEMIKICAKFI